MLGGIVIKGDNLGKGYGYPTANLDIKKRPPKLSQGVYGVTAKLLGKEYQGAMSYKEKPVKVEVYLFDYEGPDFYGKFLEVNPIQKVAEMEFYDNEEELKKKIAIDIVKVKHLFNK